MALWRRICRLNLSPLWSVVSSCIAANSGIGLLEKKKKHRGSLVDESLWSIVRIKVDRVVERIGMNQV